MNSVPFDYLGKKYMKFKGSYWMLLFHHNYTGKVMFEDRNEAINSNNPKKYSILYLLNDEYRTLKHGTMKYEFIINWPNLSYYFQWRQTKNPLDENDIIGISEVNGYEPIHVKNNPHLFGGLAKDANFSRTLLNGQLGHTNWCTSIGMLKTADWANIGIPASCEAANVVDLFVKTKFALFASNCNYNQCSSTRYICYFFVFVFVSND